MCASNCWIIGILSAHFSHKPDSPTTCNLNSVHNARMSDLIPLSRISTHYYKIAHLLLVNYAVYTAKETSLDQFLLELELQIRDRFPRILLTYYSKCLYHFEFGHISDGSPSSDSDTTSYSGKIRLDQHYPQLALKRESSTKAAFLSKPAKHHAAQALNKKDQSVTEEHLAFVSLTFFKAVKKMIVYNLCLKSDTRMFGNYVVTNNRKEDGQYSVIQLDPVVLENGDLIVSLFQTNRLVLWDSQLVRSNEAFVELANSFVIYVVPSGLRCHFYDPLDYSQTFTTAAPKSSHTLLRLLKLSTGIDLTNKQNILWTKLIPNLQHLNNLTSNISHFIHEVDNKKYIMWPWELCLLQFGSHDITSKPKDKTSWSIDPLGLINRILDSNIAAKDHLSHNKDGLASVDMNAASSGQNFNFNAPSSLSTGKSSGHGATMEDISIRLETPQLDDFNYAVSQPIEREVSNPKAEQEIITGEDDMCTSSLSPPRIARKVDYNDSDTNDAEYEGIDDDLFGDGSEPEVFENDPVTTSIRDNNKGGHSSTDFSGEGTHRDTNFTPDKMNNREIKDLEAVDQGTPTTFVNIPKDQMISDLEPIPSSYKDPGAPLPVVPTPVIPLRSSFPHSTVAFSDSSISHKDKVASTVQNSTKNERLNDFSCHEQRQGYVFSPIKFNPVIRSSIDTKYGKGGKFYVSHEPMDEADTKGRRMRETSVSHGSPLHLSNDYNDNDNESGQDIKLLTKLRAPERTNGSTGESGGLDSDLQVEDHLSRQDRREIDFQGSTEILENLGENDNVFDDAVPNESDDVDDEGGEEDESDEDEEVENDELETSPLRLNTSNQDPALGGPVDTNRNPSSNAYVPMPRSNVLSPASGVINIKVESPSTLAVRNELHGQSLSPMSIHQLELKDDLVAAANDTKDIDMSVPATSAASPTSISSSGMGESSNCLPLILRSINVLTIPPAFVLREEIDNWDGVTMLTGFDMDVVEEVEDLSNSNAGPLNVRGTDLDEYLRWVTSNLVFDFGNFETNAKILMRLPGDRQDERPESMAETEPSESMRNSFEEVFPLSSRVNLNEFRFGFSKQTDENSGRAQLTHMDNQLAFLEPAEGLQSQTLDMNSLYWDSIYYDAPGNQRNATSYWNILKQTERKWALQKGNDEAFLEMYDVKAKVLKPSSEIINFDFVGLRFWRYLNLTPVNRDRKFQILLISEYSPETYDLNVFENGNLSLLNMLRNNYKDNHFGDIKKLSLQTAENRQDLEGVINGTVLAERPRGDHSYSKFYSRTDKRLRSLAELIKLDLINKNNRFDFDRPLLLLFVNFDQSVDSISQISKLCRNFKAALKAHQLSLVEVFSHIIPGDKIVKQSAHLMRLKYISNTELTNLSMMLYNKCPDSKPKHSARNAKGTTGLFTRLIKERPESLSFKATNRGLNNDTDATLSEDLFLHVAYERSVDRRWISAAWSDPHGIVTHTKSWHCTTKRGGSSSAHDTGEVITEIWEISNSLLKFLSADDSRRACGSGGKRFLVLTRVNSILPDDELVFWKRLTAKHKEVSLVVLTANRLPRLTFSLQERALSDSGISEHTPSHSVSTSANRNHSVSGLAGVDLIKAFNGGPFPYMSSPNTAEMNTLNSPMNPGGINVLSPHQFVNVPGNFLSPHDGNGASNLPESNATDEMNLHLRDACLDLIGFIPQTSLPSSNSPTRLGMKTGYLIRDVKSKGKLLKGLMVFELSLLSCSSQWNLNSIMKILLNQFKKLIYLNHIIGICGLASTSGKDDGQNHRNLLRSMVPWHINAIGKSLDYLVHIRVDEES